MGLSFCSFVIYCFVFYGFVAAPYLDVSVVGPDVDVVVLGAVAAVGRGLCLSPDRGLGVLVEGGQVNLLSVHRHVKCEPGNVNIDNQDV